MPRDPLLDILANRGQKEVFQPLITLAYVAGYRKRSTDEIGLARRLTLSTASPTCKQANLPTSAFRSWFA